MGRPIYCLMCDAKYMQVAGVLPDYCPGCKLPARWTTNAPKPRNEKKYALTLNDKRFLRSIRIAQDDDDFSA